MLLENNTAIIYGGAGAVGGATVRVFAREGARVHLAGRTAETLEKVAAEIRADGGSAETAVVDVLDEAAVRAHADSVATEHGIDIVLNAVGIAHVQGPPLADLSLAEFLRPVDGSVRAHFITAKAVAPHLAASGSGVYLTLSTPGARLTGSGFLGNGVSSAAVEAFSRLLAGELGPAGVRVVCMRPHALPDAVATSHTGDVFPGIAQRAGLTVDEWLAGAAGATTLGRLPTTTEVAEYAAFAASNRASALTGAIINLTCGALVD